MVDPTLEHLARDSGLTRVGVRPPLGAYLREAWERRELFITMALYENDAQSAHYFLGRWWLILQPALQATIYGLIFGVILGSGRPNNFFPFMFSGVFLFTVFSGAILSGSSAIPSNSGLIKSVSFPRILLPASVTLRQVLNYLPTLPITAAILLIFDHGFKFETVYFPFIFIGAVMLAFGFALISARLTVKLRDVSKLLPFVTRILFYVSGVFISIDKLFAAHPLVIKLCGWNPIYAYLSLARGALVYGYTIDPYLIFTASVWTVVALVAGVLIFWSAEEEFGNV